VIVAAAAVYLTVVRLSLWFRLVLVALLGSAFFWTSAAWTRHFEGKFREAYNVVKAAGGHTYDGPRYRHHFFWHALWCGLGDFDDKYGYYWSDMAAFRYAWPIMQRRGFQADGFPPDRADELDTLTLGVYWDKARLYARTPFETREFVEIVRNKVLYDIVTDPLWYASILRRRAARLLHEVTPPSFALGNGVSVSLPGRAIWGYLGLAVVVGAIVTRNWFHLKLLAFTLPLSFTALAVYSGRGTVYYSVLHLVAFAIAAVGLRHALNRRVVGLAVLAGRWAIALPAGSRHRFAELLTKARGGLSATGRSWRDPRGWRALRRALTLGAAALVALSVMGGLLAAAWPEMPSPVARPESAETVVAVLRFENETWDPSLTWVCDAAGALLATALANAGVTTLGPDRVQWLDPDMVWWGAYSILSGSPLVAINVTAERAGLDSVLTGRIRPGAHGLLACAELQGPGRPRPMQPEHCEPIDGDSLLQASERLARALLPALGVTRDRRAVLPSRSVDAFRAYAEGLWAARRQMWGQAARSFETALREDPDIRPAAVELARLRARSGTFDPETLRALGGSPLLSDVLIALDAESERRPTWDEARIDLGRLLVHLELYEEAEKVLTPILTSPAASPEGFGLVAELRSARGHLDRGYQALLEYQRRTWQEPLGHGFMADHLTRWGQYRLAAIAVDCEPLADKTACAEYQRRSRGMAPLTLDDLIRRWRLAVLQDRWPEAQQLAAVMVSVDDARSAGVGTLHLARHRLFLGRSKVGAALAEEAASQMIHARLDPSEAVSTAADVYLERGDAAAALGVVRGVRANDSVWVDPRVRFWEALALAHLGRWADAERTARDLAAALSAMPGPRARRLVRHLEGELYLARGDATRAVSSFNEAARLLPARGFCNDHVPVWYGLARANLAAGAPEQAETWLQRITTSSYERLCWPLPYARSFALLGRIHAAAGREDDAEAAFERFLQLWGKADLAHAEQSEARRLVHARAERTAMR
jgi:tetratricopeptide (TPR) repeat protein